MFVISVTTDDVTEHGFCTTHPDFAKFLVRVTCAVAWASHDPGPRCSDGFSFVDDDMFVRYWPLKDSASTSGTSTVSDSPLDSTDSAPQCMLRLTHRGQHWTQAESDVSALAYLLEKHFFHRKCPFAGNYAGNVEWHFFIWRIPHSTIPFIAYIWFNSVFAVAPWYKGNLWSLYFSVRIEDMPCFPVVSTHWVIIMCQPVDSTLLGKLG